MTGGKLELHPGRLTWNLQITHLEKEMILQTSMTMFHVNLQGCIRLAPLKSNSLALFFEKKGVFFSRRASFLVSEVGWNFGNKNFRGDSYLRRFLGFPGFLQLQGSNRSEELSGMDEIRNAERFRNMTLTAKWMAGRCKRLSVTLDSHGYVGQVSASICRSVLEPFGWHRRI